ncbi:MAG: MFS transporter [Streptosporangiales bacterium]|nr:MFS transporter [Streptosporangiales bacterium]
MDLVTRARVLRTSAPPAEDRWLWADVAQLASFAVFGLTFAVRLLGALFFGSLGDRIGRQRTLALVVLLISGATLLIGLLPTHATVGVLAPILLVLLRTAQGFSAGGETGNAYTFLTEYAPEHRRGFFTSFGNVSAFLGALLGSSIVTVEYLVLSDAAMESWGWRLPFLIAGPIGVIGLYLRLKLEDTPHFKALDAEGAVEQAPLRGALRTEWRPIIRCGLIGAMHGVGFYMVLTYIPSYLAEKEAVGSAGAFVATMTALVVAIAVLPLTGYLSDRIGRRKVTIAACVGYLLLSYPAFSLMLSGELAKAILGAIFGIYGRAVRLHGGAVSHREAGQFVLPRLQHLRRGTGWYDPVHRRVPRVAHRNELSPTWYLGAVAVLALVSALLSKETAGRPLRRA